MSRRAPHELNVNPCALLLKERPDVDENTPVSNRYKAKLLMDLLRGRVNERFPHWELRHGTVDLALSRMTRGEFSFVVDLQDCFLNWRLCEDDSICKDSTFRFATNLVDSFIFLLDWSRRRPQTMTPSKKLSDCFTRGLTL